MIASGDVVNFGRSITYDPQQNLLIQLRNIDRDDLLPIALEDWIELVEPYNADPLNPR